MTLCQIKNPRLVLICCLNNSTRGIFIIPSQEETILNLEILRQVGREGRFWLTGTIQIPTNMFSWMTGIILLVNYPCSPKTSPRALVPGYLYSGTRVSRARCHNKFWFIACSGCRPTFFLIQKNWCKPRLYG